MDSVKNIKRNQTLTIFKNIRWKLTVLCLGFQLYSCTGLYSPPYPRSGIPKTERDRLIQYAKSYVGTPYRYGGTDRNGIDCSGLVVRVFQDLYNQILPHKSSLLYQKGLPISTRGLEVGDLVFFRQDKRTGISHVGIYLGKGSFIHATRSRGVMVSHLNERYHRTRYMGARRITVTNSAQQ